MLETLREAALAAKKKSGPACATCVLQEDVLVAVRQLRAEGLPFPAISVALRSEGLSISPRALAQHFREHE